MVLNIYKPRGFTSNDVVQIVKKKYGFKRVGHAGTLDPLAEGVLIVLTDEDTKRQLEFMNMEKEYLVKMGFGYVSDSYDLGTLLREKSKDLADKLCRKDLESVLGNFVGLIDQKVPAYSAVKVSGSRLYKLVRSGAVNEHNLPMRKVLINDIRILSFLNNDHIIYSYGGNNLELICTTAKLIVSCGKGTYIRSLVRDIGDCLGCGAVVLELVRTKVGGYTLEGSIRIL